MKIIALIAVIAIIVLQWSGAVPNSSVGGAMTVAAAFFAAAIAAGIHDAWTNRRGIIGWIVSVVTAFVGALVAGMVGGMLMDIAMPLIASLTDLKGSLAESRHPLLYITSAAMMLITLSGAWLALRLVNRWR